MKSLNRYSEYIKNSTVGSIKENVSDSAMDGKSTVLSYLKSGRRIGAISGSSRDIFTDKPIKGELIVLSDGEYEWTSDIIYYFDKYNLALPSEFITKSLTHSNAK